MGKFIPNENTEILFATAAPGGIPSPVITVATAAAGGTLAAGTYAYRVVSLNANGRSLASPEVTVVAGAGAVNANTITWAAIAGATAGYDIYGRTVGTERRIGHVASGVLTFTDTGAVSPLGPLPRSDTSGDLHTPRVSDIAGAVRLTHFVVSFNASAQGQAVPTPAFDTKFETSIDGTTQATFTADFYSDDEENLAWDTLLRSTKGFFIISRFGGMPVEGADCEVWPVTVLSRAIANMANNTVVSFTVTCSVPQEPAEDAIVVA